MAIVVFVILLLGSLTVLLLLARQTRDRTYLAPAWLGWIGSLLVCGAFLILPWVTMGPNGTFQRNAEWLTENVTVFEDLKQVPALQSLLASLEFGSLDAVHRTLSSPETDEFLNLVEQGVTLPAWTLLRLAWPVSPLLSLALTGGLLAASIGLVASCLALSATPASGRALGVASGALAALSVVLLAVRVPVIDTIGNTDNILIRLISVMGGVQVASGGWCMVLGCMLLLAAGAWYVLLGQPAPMTDPNEPSWSQYAT